MENILAHALKRAAKAEVIEVQTNSNSIKFENNRLKYIREKEACGWGLRLIREGKIGFSSTTDPSQRRALVENALEVSGFGQKAAFEFPGASQKNPVCVFDKKVSSFTAGEAVEEGEKIIGAIREECPDCHCKVEIDKTIGKTRLINSVGLDEGYKKSSFHLYVEVLKVEEDSLLSVYDYYSSAKLIQSTDFIIDRIKQRLTLSKQTAGLASGRYPVIFTPKAVPTLLHSVEIGVNGKMIQKGSSPLTDRWGELIFDPQLTIYDDAGIDFCAGSAPIDDEGIATQKIPIVEDGILKNFLFDLQTAALRGRESTGNGYRYFDSLPSPASSNLSVSPGNMEWNKTVRGLKEGVIVDQVLGGGQSNVLGGEFSVNIGLGFLVKEGEVIGRIKDCMVAGNIYESFNSLVGLGQKAEIYGGIITPFFYFEALPVVGGR
ncbi:MAG: TldD/PmbA family protein [bacterium]